MLFFKTIAPFPGPSTLQLVHFTVLHGTISPKDFWSYLFRSGSRVYGWHLKVLTRKISPLYGTPYLPYDIYFHYLWWFFHYMRWLHHYTRWLFHYIRYLVRYMWWLFHYMRCMLYYTGCFFLYTRCFSYCVRWLIHYTRCFFHYARKLSRYTRCYLLAGDFCVIRGAFLIMCGG